jgi:hypothetical protein
MLSEGTQIRVVASVASEFGTLGNSGGTRAIVGAKRKLVEKLARGVLKALASANAVGDTGKGL